jgi:hypothetical protein
MQRKFFKMDYQKINSLRAKTLYASFFAAALLGNVRATVVDLGWSADGTFSRNATIAPKQFLEICGPLVVKESVTWRFEASRGIDFNIHYHVGKDVTYLAKADSVKSMSAEFVAKLDQEYCWMWSNTSDQPISFKVQLKK